MSVGHLLHVCLASPRPIVAPNQNVGCLGGDHLVGQGSRGFVNLAHRSQLQDPLALEIQPGQRIRQVDTMTSQRLGILGEVL